MSAFRSDPVDRRRLNMRDRSDFNQSGGYARDRKQDSQVRAYKGAMDYDGKRQERTTTQTPGTGGMTQGLSIQQERQRNMGEAKERAQSFRPPTKSEIYDIYD